MLAPGRTASRARATEGAAAGPKVHWPATYSNNIRQYMSYKIASCWVRLVIDNNNYGFVLLLLDNTLNKPIHLKCFGRRDELGANK